MVIVQLSAGEESSSAIPGGCWCRWWWRWRRWWDRRLLVLVGTWTPTYMVWARCPTNRPSSWLRVPVTSNAANKVTLITRSRCDQVLKLLDPLKPSFWGWKVAGISGIATWLIFRPFGLLIYNSNSRRSDWIRWLGIYLAATSARERWHFSRMRRRRSSSHGGSMAIPCDTQVTYSSSQMLWHKPFISPRFTFPLKIAEGDGREGGINLLGSHVWHLISLSGG